MSTIGIRNQDDPNKNSTTSGVPENPAYPSGISPSRTKKTPNEFALRTTLSGKVSFVSAYVLEGVRTSAVHVPAKTVQHGVKRIWVTTFTSEKIKGPAAERRDMQSFCDCVTNKDFNKRYTEHVYNKGLTLASSDSDGIEVVEELRVMLRNPGYYGNVHTALGYARLCLLYLEPDKNMPTGFSVQCLRVHDNTSPTHFAYAQAIIGPKLDQLSFEQEQRYNEALAKSKVVNKQQWHEWDSLHVDEQNQRVNALLMEFNNGTQLGDVQ